MFLIRSVYLNPFKNNTISTINNNRKNETSAFPVTRTQTRNNSSNIRLDARRGKAFTHRSAPRTATSGVRRSGARRPAHTSGRTWRSTARCPGSPWLGPCSSRWPSSPGFSRQTYPPDTPSSSARSARFNQMSAQKNKPNTVLGNNSPMELICSVVKEQHLYSPKENEILKDPPPQWIWSSAQLLPRPGSKANRAHDDS